MSQLPHSKPPSRSPVHSLPNELLLLIFGRTLPPDANYSSSPDYHPTMAFISRTCARWRSISFYEPHLWTRIQFCWPDNIFMLYVQRSRVLSLTLYLMGGIHPLDSIPSSAPEILSKSERVRERTRHLHFGSPPVFASGLEKETRTLHSTSVALIRSGYYPVIEKLTVSVERPHLPVPDSSSSPNHNTHISVLIAKSILSTFPQGIPGGLRSLSVRNVDLQIDHDIPACFGMFTELEELDLEGLLERIDSRPDEQRVELPMLRTLRLALESHAAMRFLSLVKTPKITKMEYALLDRRGETDIREDGGWSRVEELLVGVEAQIVSVERIAFDVLELELSSDGVAAELSGPAYRLKLVLPGLVASDIPALIHCLPIPSSSQLTRLVLHAPPSSNSTFVSSLLTLPPLKNVHTIALHALASSL